MTLQELSRYYKLKKRLERNREILISLEEAVQPGAQPLTGIPHASGIRDKVGGLAIEIADMRTRIGQLEQECSRAEREIDAYINTIENDQTRTIFRLRFSRCLTWGEVAALVGGMNTEKEFKAFAIGI